MVPWTLSTECVCGIVFLSVRSSQQSARPAVVTVVCARLWVRASQACQLLQLRFEVGFPVSTLGNPKRGKAIPSNPSEFTQPRSVPACPIPEPNVYFCCFFRGRQSMELGRVDLKVWGKKLDFKSPFTLFGHFLLPLSAPYYVNDAQACEFSLNDGMCVTPNKRQVSTVMTGELWPHLWIYHLTDVITASAGGPISPSPRWGN